MLPGALVMLVAGPFAGRARAPLRRQGAARRWARSSPPSRSAADGPRPRHAGRDGRVEHRALDRHRARVRRDAEPDLRRRPAVGDRRGDRLQHARALRRRVAGLADLGRDPHRQRRRRRRAARPTTATRPRSSSRPASRWWPRSSRSRSRASGDSVPRRGAARDPPRAGATRSDERRAPHPRRRRPQLRAGARGRGRGARGEGRGGRRAGDRRARRGRQGHGLPLLPDQGPPRSRRCSRERLRSMHRRTPARRPSARTRGRRSSTCWCDSAERQAGDCTFSAGLSHESALPEIAAAQARRCTTRWTR